MIENGTLDGMQKRVGLGPTGEEMFAELVPLAVGIFLDEVKNSQRWDLGAVIKAAVMCAFVPKEDERGGACPSRKKGTG